MRLVHRKMEISNCVWRQPKVLGGVRRRLRIGPIEFNDKSHLRYYLDARCGLKTKNEKKAKTKTKTMKQNPIAVFEKGGGEEEEGAFWRKQHKKMKKQAKRMMVQEDDSDSSSSSSSSSSSDSDGGGNCKTATAIRDASALLRMPLLQEPRVLLAEAPELELAEAPELASPSPSSGVRVAVCMGNKCRKMGAERLMEELQLSGETVALPCKCMGKCKSAPNVKVLRLGPDDEDTLFPNVNLSNISTILHHQLLLPA